MSIKVEDNAPDDVGGPKSSYYEFNLYVTRSFPVFSAEGTIVTADVTSGTQEEIPEVTEIFNTDSTGEIPLDPVT